MIQGRSHRGTTQNFFKKLLTQKKGVTLIELMVTLAVFGILVGMIYSVYNTFLKSATTERKVVKTEMDVVSVAWPLIKEIQSAGFGIPSAVTAINVTAGNLTVRSTAAGDSEHAGKWGYVVSNSCMVSTTNIPAGQTVVVISSSDRSKLSPSPPPPLAASGTALYISSCGDYNKQLYYWSPYTSSGNLEYYETIYSLGNLTGTEPSICAPGTRSLKRSSSKTGTTSFDPVLDCVLYQDSAGTNKGFDFRFGCINLSGALTWHTDRNCTGAVSSPKLRLVKIGVIVQSSPRRDSQVDATMTLFEDLIGVGGASLKSTITLTNEQRYYKWRKIEQTIALRNLE